MHKVAPSSVLRRDQINPVARHRELPLDFTINDFRS
jgi:hypothetical protein